VQLAHEVVIEMLRSEERTDIELRADVEAELEDDVSLDAARIGVAVSEGVVTLTGELRSYWQKLNAERDVERIDGVHGVVNQIEVHLPSEHTDPTIAAAAVRALEHNTQIPRDRVTVRVAHGWVTLLGEVDYEYQRRAAARTARDLPGVKGVSNEVAVMPMVVVADVRDKIERTFERQALIDARKVSVSVDGQAVTLGGTVRSWAERREAEKAAAAAPGVTSVENHIEVRAY
jgi:osmotically-inducible protein OsmY